MFKRIFSLMAAALSAAFILAACGGQAHAADNIVTTPDGRFYSVYDVRTITVGNGSFSIERVGGNSPVVVADPAGSIFAAAKLSAPALKNLVQVGTSGLWLNKDLIVQGACQYGVGISTSSTPLLTGGDHTLIVWQQSGYLLIDDQNCATATTIRTVH